MVVFTLTDPRNNKVFHVGESKNLHVAVGSILIRREGPVFDLLQELEDVALMPIVKVHDMETKEELVAKHIRTVITGGRKGGTPTSTLIAGAERAMKVWAWLEARGVPKSKLQKVQKAIFRRGVCWARQKGL